MTQKLERVRSLIVDDEPLARRRLRELLTEVDWIDCVGEADNGETAVRSIDEARPDLVFLDIQMPILSGLQVLERITHQPAVVFTTAHDYALQAFELQALDYLLKPFGREWLQTALHRVRRFIGTALEPATVDRTREALASPARLTRLLVRHGKGIVPVDVSDIEQIQAEGDYVALVVQGRRHLIYLSMGEIQRRLDPERFIRVHRSQILSFDHIVRVIPYGDGRLEVEMRNGAKVLASRAGSRVLRELCV